MYESLKEWIDIPFKLKVYNGRDSTGNKVISKELSILCYPVAENKLVTNKYGAEIVSSTQLYIMPLPELTDVLVECNVIFEGAERPIQAAQTYYRAGLQDITVLML